MLSSMLLSSTRASAVLAFNPVLLRPRLMPQAYCSAAGDADAARDAVAVTPRVLSEHQKKVVAYRQRYACAACDCLLPPTYQVPPGWHVARPRARRVCQHSSAEANTPPCRCPVPRGRTGGPHRPSRSGWIEWHEQPAGALLPLPHAQDPRAASRACRGAPSPR
eukprot:2150624-Prymnesium_polylepis.1